jgi:hypothetical protein
MRRKGKIIAPRKGAFNVYLGEFFEAGATGAIVGNFQFAKEKQADISKVRGIVWPTREQVDIMPNGLQNAHDGKAQDGTFYSKGFLTLTDIKGNVFIKNLPASVVSGRALGEPFFFVPRFLDYTRCFISYPAGSIELGEYAGNVMLTLLTVKDGK